MPKFKRHAPLILVLFLHLALSLAYAALIPLGEAPDERAQLNYGRFIAEKRRLPATLAERQAADYRSNWPPLYHVLIAGPLIAVGDAPPTRLKAVGDTARRLIPTDGQTIAAFIHTADEAWPWRGLPLAWRLSRFISVALTTLAVLVTYLLVWQLTERRPLATLAAALQAFIPQFLFIGSVVNDDNLLVLLSGLVLLTLVYEAKRGLLLQPGAAFRLGLLFGLAMVAKYNALPLAGVLVCWYGCFAYHRYRVAKKGAAVRERRFRPETRPPAQANGEPGVDRNRDPRTGLGSPQIGPGRLLNRLVVAGAAWLGGAALTGGWWFIFIWLRFNQVEQAGLLRGSFAALAASTSDASLRNLAGGRLGSFPPLADWPVWFTTLFRSFWGLFGGGGTIDFPGWIYWLLALFCCLALVSLSLPRRKQTNLAVSLPNQPAEAMFPLSAIRSLFLLTPLFFLPLPLLRFILSGGSLAETAQGRHLFPALPAIVWGLVWGLSSLGPRLSNFKGIGAGLVNSADQPRICQPDRFRAGPAGAVGWAGGLSARILKIKPLFDPALLLLGLLFFLAIYTLPLIRRSYPPPIPLRTTAGAAPAGHLLNARLTGSITLVGYEIEPVSKGALPITLVWRAETVPAQDYLIQLSLADAAGRPLGGWLGHPVGGRYPTRAWDGGDILRHTVPVPLLPGSSPAGAVLTLDLFDALNQPAAEPLLLTDRLLLPPIKPVASTPAPLRADGLAPDSPFTYRHTLSFVLPGLVAEPTLIASDGTAFEADQFLTDQTSSIAHFIVAASWPSGDYYLQVEDKDYGVLDLAESTIPARMRRQDLAPGAPAKVKIENRSRRFEPPPMDRPVEANFGGVVTLLGYDLPDRRVEPGDNLPLTLHWRAETTLGQNLAVFNHLLDSTMTQRGGIDRIPLNHYTTLLWVPGEIVSDAYLAPVDANAPPGVYWLDVGLYPTGRPEFSLPLFEGGRPVDRNSVPLGPIKVGGPPPDITRTEVQPQIPGSVTFGDQITLLGFELTDAPGKPIFPHRQDALPPPRLASARLTLFWQAESVPPADYTVFVHLLDGQGELVAQFDGPPAGGAYPTSLWEPGEIIVDRRLLAETPVEIYQLRIGLYRTDTGERLRGPQAPQGGVDLMSFAEESR